MILHLSHISIVLEFKMFLRTELNWMSVCKISILQSLSIQTNRNPLHCASHSCFRFYTEQQLHKVSLLHQQFCLNIILVETKQQKQQLKYQWNHKALIGLDQRFVLIYSKTKRSKTVLRTNFSIFLYFLASLICTVPSLYHLKLQVKRPKRTPSK